MSDLSLQRVGPTFGGSGTAAPFRGDITGAQVVTDAHGRFQEAALRGTLFSGGMTITSIANVTFTTATLGATGTPIIGVWNPTNSGKNLVILQIRLQPVITATTSTGYGALMLCTSVNQSAISTGITPFSRLSLSTSGSIAKVYAGTALTGLSGNLTVQEASGLGSSNGNYSEVNGTSASFAPSPTPPMIDNVDGALIIPPGGIMAILGTTTPVAYSAASSILWEEVTILS